MYLTRDTGSEEADKRDKQQATARHPSYHGIDGLYTFSRTCSRTSVGFLGGVLFRKSLRLLPLSNHQKNKPSHAINDNSYWDWSLDHLSLSTSSIFSPTTGFGSDGAPSAPPSVGQGRCVLDGPFADLRPIIYNHTYVTHCLSRGFNDPKGNVTTGGKIPGDHFKPETIGEILRVKGYEEFEKQVEEKLHNGLHPSVGGDFRAMTAANGMFVLPHFPVGGGISKLAR